MSFRSTGYEPTDFDLVFYTGKFYHDALSATCKRLLIQQPNPKGYSHVGLIVTNRLINTIPPGEYRILETSPNSLTIRMRDPNTHPISPRLGCIPLKQHNCTQTIYKLIGNPVCLELEIEDIAFRLKNIIKDLIFSETKMHSTQFVCFIYQEFEIMPFGKVNIQHTLPDSLALGDTGVWLVGTDTQSGLA